MVSRFSEVGPRSLGGAALWGRVMSGRRAVLCILQSHLKKHVNSLDHA
jgi:hypothetical protein